MKQREDFMSHSVNLSAFGSFLPPPIMRMLQLSQ